MGQSAAVNGRGCGRCRRSVCPATSGKRFNVLPKRQEQRPRIECDSFIGRWCTRSNVRVPVLQIEVNQSCSVAPAPFVAVCEPFPVASSSLLFLPGARCGIPFNRYTETLLVARRIMSTLTGVWLLGTPPTPPPPTGQTESDVGRGMSRPRQPADQPLTYIGSL